MEHAVQDVVIRMNEPRLWIAMVCTLLFFLAGMRYLQGLEVARRDKILKILGVFCITLIGVQHILQGILPELEWHVHRALPLHLCGISFLLTGLNCIIRKAWIWEILIFTGIVGGVHSMLSPQLPQGDSPYFFFVYYFKHGALLFLPILAWKIGDFRFRRFSWLRMVLWMNALAVVIFAIDYGLNTWYPGKYVANYMYVWEPPMAENPLIIGPWPYYLFAFEGFMVAHFLVIQFIFSMAQKKGATVAPSV